MILALPVIMISTLPVTVKIIIATIIIIIFIIGFISFFKYIFFS